jgi:flagellar biosynthesis protein FlhG
VTKGPESKSKIIKFSNLRSTLKSKSERLSNNQNTVKRPRIIAITSGKGGVGKTNIVVNLGFSLGKFGKKSIDFRCRFGIGQS